jgi:hypothetical protein
MIAALHKPERRVPRPRGLRVSVGSGNDLVHECATFHYRVRDILGDLVGRQSCWESVDGRDGRA